ncbi:MAG TPA: sulfotransferase domain-containing protein, partial [Longimicrobiales bacterium]
MIVWLSSYPRSGNTLLRTVLKRCMGLDSYADEPLLIQSAVFSDAQYVGHRELPATWPEFYAAATAAPEVALVKTHLPPRDEQPFIYVVRDGRSAVRSYRKYYEKYLPDHRASIYQIIAGDDAYGHWTSHYRAWMGRGAPVMLVRYEELLNIGPP